MGSIRIVMIELFQLRMREAKADAEDLQSTEFEVGDTAHLMKKVNIPSILI